MKREISNILKSALAVQIRVNNLTDAKRLIVHIINEDKNCPW